MDLIKGINRQIIEVTDTGNEYFERAFLFVRQGFSDAAPGRLHEEAQRFLKNSGGYTGLYFNRRRRIRSLLVHGGAFGGAGLLLGMLFMAVIR